MTDLQEIKRNADKAEVRSDTAHDKLPLEEWLAIRKAAGLKIDPETAEVFWKHGYTIDPYDVDSNLPKECQCIGPLYFARSPGSDIWVSFYDLPDDTRNALREKINAGHYPDDSLDWLFND